MKPVFVRGKKRRENGQKPLIVTPNNKPECYTRLITTLGSCTGTRLRKYASDDHPGKSCTRLLDKIGRFVSNRDINRII